MKRAGLLVAAIVLTFGLAGGATVAKQKVKKVKTEAEIEGLRTFPGNQSEIFGDVHSKKSKCEKERLVTLVYKGDPSEDPMFDTAVTDSTGDWVVDLNMVAPPLDEPWVVVVERNKIGRGDKKRICKATTSPEHTFPEL